MEDGEIEETESIGTHDSLVNDLACPAYTGSTRLMSTEFVEHSKPSNPSRKSCPPLFRLITYRTAVLAPSHKLALLGGHTQMQVGRDVAPPGSDIPRVRLKEMAVSKVHATIFWDDARKEWSVVDMGSKHGSFLKSSGSFEGPSTSTEIDSGVRLSPPRVASVPRRLRHFDLLTIGSTTFLVHIHDDGVPCTECSPAGADEIPLFPIPKQNGSVADKRPREELVEGDHRDPKRALTMLKRSLLQRHAKTGADTAKNVYADRSARRRAHHPGSLTDTPGIPSPRTDCSLTPPKKAPLPIVVRETPLPATPPAPLPDTNIGHRLLMKQGWQPGTALGLDEGIVEPIEVTSGTGRAGLGMPNAKQLVLDSSGVLTGDSGIDSAGWRENGKRKRWDSLRLETLRPG